MFCSVEGSDRCPTCPNNPRCRHYIPGKNAKWYRCSDRTMWGVCTIPKSRCVECPLYKPPGLVGRPRSDELFDPLLDDPRAFGDQVDPVASRQETNARYSDNLKADTERLNKFRQRRAEYMRKYRNKRG